jgi:hypothetical protein
MVSPEPHKTHRCFTVLSCCMKRFINNSTTIRADLLNDPLFTDGELN